MDLGLTGKKIIIGGATRGISRAIAELFASEDADVGLFSRDAEALEDLEEKLSLGTGKVATVPFNFNEKADYQQMLTDLADRLNGVDIFVHSLSSSGNAATGDWQQSFDLDLMGAVWGCEALEPYLKASDAASVILMSSTAAVETFLVPQAFNAIKASVITYAKQLSQAWGADGVRVNAVSPGPISFPGGNWENIKGAMPELHDATVRQTVLGRLGSPQDVANAVVFLASPASEYITGINLVIDGGYTKRVQF